jgi:hypothetical protein
MYTKSQDIRKFYSLRKQKNQKSSPDSLFLKPKQIGWSGFLIFWCLDAVTPPEISHCLSYFHILWISPVFSGG